MADITTESIAAELAEMIYERWLFAVRVGISVEHAGIEALATLIDALQMSASDPQTGAAMMQAAVEALQTLPPNLPHGSFQARIREILAASVRCVPQT